MRRILARNIEKYQSNSIIQAIIVISGDGTMHEVLNGLQHKQIPVSFIPGGSGNDFRRGAMLPKKPKHIISNIIHHRKSVDYWLGIYKASQREKRHFINCLGIGFDAEVTKQANQAQLKKIFNYVHMGKIIYLIALIGELIRYKPIQLRIKLDGKIKHVNRCFLITVNNHPYFGGGMKINPQAKNAHDTLSILIIENISKWKVLALFGTVFLGKHLLFKEVKTYSAHQITIYTDKYQVDDETNYIQQVAVWKKPIPIQITGMSNVKEAQATLNR